MKWKQLAQYILTIVMILNLILFNSAFCRQEISKNVVQEQVENTLLLFKQGKTFNQGFNKLKEIGSPGIPYIIEHLETEHAPLTRIVLIQIIREVKGEEANEAVYNALWNKDPELRGMAVYIVSERKLNKAIPRLIDLLYDDEPASRFIDSGRPPDKVNDVALKALNSLVGNVCMNKNNKKKAIKCWLNWWKKQDKLAHTNIH